MKIGNNTISLVKKGLEGIQAIKKGLITVYEAFKELIASGTLPLTLYKCKGADLVDYKIYGESVQESDNLFDKNSIISNLYPNVTVFENGSVWRGFVFECMPNTTYTLSKIAGQTCYLGTSTEYPAVGVVINNKIYEPTNASVSITTGENDNYVTVFFYRTNADTIEYQTILDSIEIRQSVPTPEAPIEIESVGDKTKNLLQSDIRQYSSVGGITVTYNDDGSIHYSGTATIALALYLTRTSFILPAGTYTVSSISNSCRTYLLPGYKSGTFTLTEDTEFASVYVNIPNGAVLDNTLYPQLEEGSILTEYEPYGKYKIPVKASGKNLLPFPYREKKAEAQGTIIEALEDGGIKFSGTATGYNAITLYSGPVLGSGKITLSAQGTFEHACLQILVNEGNTILFNRDRMSTSVTIDLNDYPTADNIMITAKRDTNDVLSGVIYPQLELGEVVTDFELHVEPVTTNIYLDEPLRKIGDIADYIDFVNKKVTRIIKEDIYDGTENWLLMGTGGEIWSYFALSIGAYNSVVAYVGLNTHFERKTISSSNTNIGFSPFNSSGYNDARIGIRPNVTIYNSLALWKEFLAEQYSNGTPVKSTYILTTPTEETIELPNIPTHKGTTILSLDSKINSSYMEAMYMGMGDLQPLDSADNLILNDILATDTETELDVTNTEINQILDEIIGG